MANKRLFNGTDTKVQLTNTVNKAGGRAYTTSAEEALCQYVVTGTFNGVYYASAGEQLKDFQNTIKKCSSEIVAKAAVYSRQEAKMKDMPAYCLAELAARHEHELLNSVFNKVVNNVKMLLNFVQIVRSGVTGRKSFGSAVKRLIQNWILAQSPDKLWLGSIGHQNPSLADVIKMVHPNPTDRHNDLFAYLIGKVYQCDNLPQVLQEFELFKKDNSNPIPNIPFMSLSNCDLTDQQWQDIAMAMPWNTLRMNLNQLQRHNVFKNRSLTKRLAAKLADAEQVRRNNAFPYQLMTAYQNVSDVPQTIQVALNDALEISTENVPTLDEDIAVCVDISGSMGSSITGHRPGASSKTSCRDVAALMAACVLRKNPDALVLGWDTTVRKVKLNPRDSVLTNAKNISLPGGATDASCALKHLNKYNWKGNLVIYVSDNQSWYGVDRSYNFFYKNPGTNMAQEWAEFKKRNRKAKLVCIDIQPYDTVQVPDNKDVLNVGGFNDSVFKVIDNFVKNDNKHFVDVIRSVEL